MSQSKVAKLVDEDFGIQGSGEWLKSIKHDSLVVNTEKDLFYWNKHEIYGDALSYLLYVRRLPLESAKLIINKLDGKYIISNDFNSEEQIIYEKLIEPLWLNGKTKRDYWHKRLLNDSTIDRFKLGYYDGWYTIPIFENGKLVNIQKRRDEPEKAIHPWYRKPPELFNSGLLNIVDTVYLTEGIVDSILLNQLGIPAISKVTGANGWLEEWSKYFMRINRVFLCFDNDPAGKSGARRVARSLGEYKCKIYTFDSFSDKYDVIDYFRDGYNKDDFIKLVEKESKYVFEV